MALVEFQLRREFDCAPATLWQALSDWRSHGEWIPATRVQVLAGDGGVGTRFVARTGIGPIGFDDNMTVTEFDSSRRRAEVRKTGPLLLGSAGFEVEATTDGSALYWHEEVRVPLLPKALVPSVAFIGRALFGQALGRLARYLARS